LGIIFSHSYPTARSGNRYSRSCRKTWVAYFKTDKGGQGKADEGAGEVECVGKGSIEQKNSPYGEFFCS
jgi:hypothetical protein